MSGDEWSVMRGIERRVMSSIEMACAVLTHLSQPTSKWAWPSRVGDKSDERREAAVALACWRSSRRSSAFP